MYVDLPVFLLFVTMTWLIVDSQDATCELRCLDGSDCNVESSTLCGNCLKKCMRKRKKRNTDNPDIPTIHR